MDDRGSQGSEDGADSYTLLRHPSGSPVYLVGTAHVSRKAAEDAAALIARVSPAILVLELDEARKKKLLEQAERGDVYGVQKLQHKSTWEIIKMSFTGEGLSFFMSSIYTITGALMGTTPGGEFLAAIQAAQERGAQVMLADRSQDATMKRLQYYTRHLTRQDSRRQEEVRRMRGMMGQATGREIDSPTDTAIGAPGPGFFRRDPPPTPTEAEVAEEVAAVAGAGDPWGLGPDDNTEAGMRRRLLEMMREGGCVEPNRVLEAARRLFQDGLDPKASIRPADVLAVRECGSKLVESFRQRAIQGDDTWMQRLEQEQVAGAKGAAGMDRSNAAMKKVIVDERDLILARHLWEAGLEAGDQAVVGVVGAGHIKGITRYWPIAGEAATEERVQRYLQVPQEDTASPWVTAAVGTAVLGTIAVRRPKAAALFAGAVTLTVAPYLGFMLVTVNRFAKFASKLVSTVETMDSGSAGFSEGGWAEGGGGDEWQ